MMRPVAPLLIAVVVGLGCRTTHLGPAQGRAYRSAFAAQVNNQRPMSPEAMDASDALMVLERHRSVRAPGASGRGGGAAASSGGGGSAGVAAGSFNLQGK